MEPEACVSSHAQRIEPIGSIRGIKAFLVQYSHCLETTVLYCTRLFKTVQYCIGDGVKASAACC